MNNHSQIKGGGVASKEGRIAVGRNEKTRNGRQGNVGERNTSGRWGGGGSC